MPAYYTDCSVIQCTCGRDFAQLNAYTNHQRTCKKRKKHLSSALAKAKLVWDNRKKRRTGNDVGELSGTDRTGGHQSPGNGLEFSQDKDEPPSVRVPFDLKRCLKLMQ